MRSNLIRLVMTLLLVLGAGPAFAQLERVGPVAPANGYPAWYQDKTGLALEFCQPLNQAELDGGWCLLLPADTTAPEVFPTSFSEEHFYWAGNAIVPMPNNGGNAILVLGLEGAFGGGPVLAGDQNRLRSDPDSLRCAGRRHLHRLPPVRDGSDSGDWR
jgi:hypothetical protein